MENQHRHIKGYRELSAEEIALMNEIKEQGVKLQELVKKVQQHVCDQRNASQVTTQEEKRLFEAEPARWAAIGRTHFQEGLMALTRAVAQPTTF